MTIVHRGGSTVQAVPDPLRAALAYAQRLGWAVIPVHGIRDDGCCTCGRADCASPGKHPLTKRGVHDAATDPDTIRGWWSRWPWANVAVATGVASGFIALDIDPRHGGGESLRDLEKQHGPLPETVEQITGGGGRHLLFRHPGHRAPNAVGLAPGLDVRGDGGYILAAPSLHVSGRRYEWELSSRPGRVPLAEPPAWLLTLVGAGERQTPALDWRQAITEGVPEGRRNATLASIVGALLRAHVPVRAVLEFAVWLNANRFEPPLPEAEVLRVVDSIAGREARRRGGGCRASG